MRIPSPSPAYLSLQMLSYYDQSALRCSAVLACLKVRECGSAQAQTDADSMTAASSTGTAPPASEEGEESVAEGLAKTMRSPWPTPPAVTVDVEPLRGMRQLVIQVFTFLLVRIQCKRSRGFCIRTGCQIVREHGSLCSLCFC